MLPESSALASLPGLAANISGRLVKPENPQLREAALHCPWVSLAGTETSGQTFRALEAGEESADKDSFADEMRTSSSSMRAFPRRCPASD